MPRIDADKFIARLSAGKAVPAVALDGDDAFLRESLRATLIEKLVPENAREWGVGRFSLRDTDLAEILSRAQTLPMLAPCQVLVVSDLEVLQGRPSASDSGEEDEEEQESAKSDPRHKTIQQLADYLDDPAPFTTLVLEALQLDQRMKLAKLLADKALVVSVRMAEGSTSAAMVAAMARRMARDLGVEIDPAAADDLVDLVDAELLRVRTEMEKLAAYVGEKKRITEADVDALVVSEKKYTIWQLAEMLAGRQRTRALEFLAGVLREGEGPPAIVGALAWMYRTLLQAQELPRSANSWDVVRQLHIRKETADIALAASRRIPREQLLAGLSSLYEADSRLKSGVHDQRVVLEFLIARLTAPLAQSKSA